MKKRSHGRDRLPLLLFLIEKIKRIKGFLFIETVGIGSSTWRKSGGGNLSANKGDFYLCPGNNGEFCIQASQPSDGPFTPLPQGKIMQLGSFRPEFTKTSTQTGDLVPKFEMKDPQNFGYGGTSCTLHDANSILRSSTILLESNGGCYLYLPEECSLEQIQGHSIIQVTRTLSGPSDSESMVETNVGAILILPPDKPSSTDPASRNFTKILHGTQAKLFPGQNGIQIGDGPVRDYCNKLLFIEINDGQIHLYTLEQ